MMKTIGIRDNICIKSEKTTCGSKMLENFISPYNATIIDKLNNANIEIKKVSMSEFGLKEDEFTQEFIKNNQGATVVTTDLKGDIANTCKKNSLFGIKPTFGLVSRYGFVSSAPSLEQIGVVGKSIEDCKEVLDIIKGYDEKDSGSVNPTEYIEKENIKIGCVGAAWHAVRVA